MSDGTSGTGTGSGSGAAHTSDDGGSPTVPVVPVAARSRKIPKVDPGLATVTASALALIGTIVTVSLRSGGGDSSTPAGNANTISATAAPANSTTGTGDDPAGDPGGSTAEPTAEPTVSMIEQLSGAERSAAETVMVELLDLSNRLPLMVEDDFTDNDYQWPLGANDSAGAGTTCAWALAGGYRTDLHSGATPGAWCSAGLAKTAQDFVVTMDAALQGTSDSEVGLLFRVDGGSHYSLRYRPLTQTISLTHVDAEGPTPILRSTAATAIQRTGSNRLTLVVNGATIAAFVNEQPVLLVENEARIAGAGAVQILLQLNEPDTDESVVVTRYEMRGS